MRPGEVRTGDDEHGPGQPRLQCQVPQSAADRVGVVRNPGGGRQALEVRDEHGDVEGVARADGLGGARGAERGVHPHERLARAQGGRDGLGGGAGGGHGVDEQALEVSGRAGAADEPRGDPGRQAQGAGGQGVVAVELEQAGAAQQPGRVDDLACGGRAERGADELERQGHGRASGPGGAGQQPGEQVPGRVGLRELRDGQGRGLDVAEAEQVGDLVERRVGRGERVRVGGEHVDRGPQQRGGLGRDEATAARDGGCERVPHTCRGRRHGCPLAAPDADPARPDARAERPRAPRGATAVAITDARRTGRFLASGVPAGARPCAAARPGRSSVVAQGEGGVAC